MSDLPEQREKDADSINKTGESTLNGSHVSSETSVVNDKFHNFQSGQMNHNDKISSGHIIRNNGESPETRIDDGKIVTTPTQTPTENENGSSPVVGKNSKTLRTTAFQLDGQRSSVGQLKHLPSNRADCGSQEKGVNGARITTPPQNGNENSLSVTSNSTHRTNGNNSINKYPPSKLNASDIRSDISDDDNSFHDVQSGPKIQYPNRNNCGENPGKPTRNENDKIDTVINIEENSINKYAPIKLNASDIRSDISDDDNSFHDVQSGPKIQYPNRNNCSENPGKPTRNENDKMETVINIEENGQEDSGGLLEMPLIILRHTANIFSWFYRRLSTFSFLINKAGCGSQEKSGNGARITTDSQNGNENGLLVTSNSKHSGTDGQGSSEGFQSTSFQSNGAECGSQEKGVNGARITTPSQNGNQNSRLVTSNSTYRTNGNNGLLKLPLDNFCSIASFILGLYSKLQSYEQQTKKSFYRLLSTSPFPIYKVIKLVLEEKENVGLYEAVKLWVFKTYEHQEIEGLVKTDGQKIVINLFGTMEERVLKKMKDTLATTFLGCWCYMDNGVRGNVNESVVIPIEPESIFQDIVQESYDRHVSHKEESFIEPPLIFPIQFPYRSGIWYSLLNKIERNHFPKTLRVGKNRYKLGFYIYWTDNPAHFTTFVYNHSNDEWEHHDVNNYVNNQVDSNPEQEGVITHVFYILDVLGENFELR